MLTTLQLRLLPAPIHPVCAWFLSGGDAGSWLAELAACGLAGPDTRLYVVPRAPDNHLAAGVLVVPATGQLPSITPHGLACGAIGGKFFLPADAALVPPLIDLEIGELCGFPLVFFHPTLGLSGMDTSSCLRVSDLLEQPSSRTEDWNRARPGVAPPAKLARIELAQAVSEQDIFGEESSDIGSEAGEPAPAAPDEPKEDAWSKAKRDMRQKFARKVADMLGRLSHSGTQRTWLNRLEDWANRQAERVAADLERLRNKELHRLLHLLDHDPEKGLRHAIPLTNFPHRGRAPAGSKLGEHGLDFNLSKLGGGPADFWSIAPELQAELNRRYRAMADRELHLQRYRRAAYIYAELLGDLASAANALKQGKHFREAAVLYEKRLGNPLAAAQCLADGGLIGEAIERYEKLGRLLEVANLYERSGDATRAREALRRLVKQKLGAGDALGAAQLLENRLQVPEEALAVLDQAWPHSRQAVQCLDAQLTILGRIGRHESASERLARLRRETILGSVMAPLTGALVEVATHYPDERVRHAAADLAQVIVARRLSEPALPAGDAAQLVRMLCKLAPHDHLLIRDGNRHLAGRNEREPTPRVVPVSRGLLEPKVIQRLALPQADWIQARADRSSFFAVGLRRREVILVRGAWEGAVQTLTWPCSVNAARNGLRFDLLGEGVREVILSVVGQPGLAQQIFLPDLFFSRPCTAGTPGWLSPELQPFVVIETNVWSIHVAAGKAILSCYDLQGVLVQTCDVTEDLLADAERTEATRLCLADLGVCRVLALGNRMLIHGANATRVELPGQVVALIPNLPYTRPAMVVLLNRGAAIYWLANDDVTMLDRDMVWTGATWTPSGKLILISAKEGRVLDVDSRGVHRVKKFAWHGRPPIAVTPANEPSDFAVFSEDGGVCIFNTGDE